MGGVGIVPLSVGQVGIENVSRQGLCKLIPQVDSPRYSSCSMCESWIGIGKRAFIIEVIKVFKALPISHGIAYLRLDIKVVGWGDVSGVAGKWRVSKSNMATG